MTIINVVFLLEGVLQSVTSFPIENEVDIDKIVKSAETFFSNECKSYGANPDDIESYIEDGFFQSRGYTLNLTWSEVIL